jgi:hypothetical protein
MVKKTVSKKTAPPPKQVTKPRQEPAALKRDFSANVTGTNGTAVAPLDDFDKQMYADAGLGVSTNPNDNITPSIAVLQPLSPQVLAGASQIENAEAGDFWVKGANPPLIGGQDGIWFQPAAMTEHWFEFVPRDSGGGFVARYEVEYDSKGRIIPPEGAEQSADNPNSYSFPESGNNCIHYRHIAGFVWVDGIGLEYVLSFHGTGHTVARSWNTKWTRKRFPDGKMMPAYSHLYHLTTDQRSNKKGTWFQISVDEGTHLRESADIVGDLHKALQMGRSLAQAFQRGEKLPGAPEFEAEDGPTTTVDHDPGATNTDRDEKIPF